MPKPRTRPRPTRPAPAAVCAANADRLTLYRCAVQDPGHEVAFADRLYRRLRGRAPVHLREDFCASAEVAAAWVASRADRTATGLDLHGPTLAWAGRQVAARLSAGQRRRLRLVKADVLRAPPMRPGPDMILALNFSYWVFTDRTTLVAYFRACLRALAPGGVLLIDFMGGSEAHLEMCERTRCRMPRDPRTGVGGPFTYVWDHAWYDPISARTTCRIHFEFPDGSRLRNAFTYHWRVWGVRELQEALADAGAGPTRVYWEGEDRRGRGTGVFRAARTGTADRSYVGYIAAEKGR